MKRPSAHVVPSGLHRGDNLPYMTKLPDGSCDLIYIDPPFCSGRKRSTSRGADSFDDLWRGGQKKKAYLRFMSPRLEQCRRLLPPHGTLYVHLDWRVSHHVRVKLDEIFGDRCFLNEIIWHYRTGGLSRRWFGRKHDTILLYAKCPGRHRFNILREGRYRTDGLKMDGDGRPYKSTKRGRLYFHPDGPALTDVWDIPFLSTVSKERTGWPTQKPEALLERIVRAGSQKDDLVADFFCGSGTTPAVAHRLDRRYLGCDISPAAIRIARKRLAQDKP